MIEVNTITEYDRGYREGYYKAVHSIYHALMAIKRDTPNIECFLRGILDAMEISLEAEDLIKS